MSDTCAAPPRNSRSLKRKRPDDDHGYDGYRPSKRLCTGEVLGTGETQNCCDASSSHNTPGLTASTTPCLSPAGAPPDPEYYLNLPYHPELGIPMYDDDFGERVCKQYAIKKDVEKLVQIWRERRYGVDVAKQYSPGSTPEPVRDAYEDEQERMIREFEAECDVDSEDDGCAPYWEVDKDKGAVTRHKNAVT